MKHRLFALAGLSALALAAPAAAQQVSPVADQAAATACAPKDPAAAVDCLDRYLTGDVKAKLRAADAETFPMYETSVGLWVKNNWGFWNGSPLFQYYAARNLGSPDWAATRVLEAYWLKARGCNYDYNDLGLVMAGVIKARDGGDACSATAEDAEKALATIPPMRRTRGATRTAAADDESDD